MKPIMLVLAFSIVLSFTVAGCDKGSSTDPLPFNLAAAQKHVITSSNTFGLTLFRAIHGLEKTRSENIFISPLSVSMALGMTLNGANGSTLDSMKKTLCFTDLSNDQINASYRAILTSLNTRDDKVLLSVANSIWYRNNFSVLPEFIQTNQRYFDAGIFPSDFLFADPINAWVSDKTHGRIPNIVANPIDPNTVMFLINAIYFKGTWMFTFDSTKTSRKPFHRQAADTVGVQMMKQEGKYLYYANEQFQMVDLPYGKGDFRMAILLPQQNQGIDELVNALGSPSWDQWVSQLDSLKGEVDLPRFKINYDLTMNEVLSLLGMEIAFEGGKADFTRINANGNLFISKVKHNSFVEVNEQGTEAAAATVVDIGYTSSYPPDESFLMRMDRPFLFVIRDAVSGTILFIGEIGNPNKDK